MRCFQIVKSVLDEMYERIPCDSEEEKDYLINQKLKELSSSYGRISVENKINHSDLVSRFAYIYSYVTSHANIVSQIIGESSALQELFNRESVNIACLGGGPGSDFLGILKYLAASKQTPKIKCSLYDKETGWGECWGDVDDKVDSSLQLRTYFHTVDVTKEESWKHYSKFLSSDFFTMIFFLSEVFSIKTQAEPFFLNVFQNARPGSILLFVDNSSKIFQNWFDEMARAANLDIITKAQKDDRIYDRAEQTTDLGVYLEKFRPPRLKADLVLRICKKQ
jgi:Putative SAM-dependent methyltransferase